jgi:hypothetical protein
MSSGAIKPTPVLDADPAVMAEARKRCAARVAAYGQADEAARYLAGANDQGWAMRFEVDLIEKEGNA